MATVRQLRAPPIQEAVIQFAFAGQLGQPELKVLANVYGAEGWQIHESHTFQAVFGPNPEQDQPPAVLHAGAQLTGFVVRKEQYSVSLGANSVAVGNVMPYGGWDALQLNARRAFQEFVDAAKPAQVERISTRFINRIRAFPTFTTFEQILERPPLPLDDLPGSAVTDFLRRHIVTNIDGGFSANLTIGTVQTDSNDDPAGRALVIDTDVFKQYELEPRFDLVEPELAKLRNIKNKLFFGSLKDDVVRQYE